MISLRNKFLFIHVPKTGGNSIQNILLPFSEDRITIVANHQDGVERFEIRNDKYEIHKHSTLKEYKEVIEPDFYAKLFKFVTIRNPWDRMISYYFSPNRMVTEWNREAFVKLVNRVQPMEYYISLDTVDSSRSFSSDVDFILKFENLQEDFLSLSKRIQIPAFSLPHRNQSDRKHYSHYYEEETIELVRNKFIAEVNYGNYQFEQR